MAACFPRSPCTTNRSWDLCQLSFSFTKCLFKFFDHFNTFLFFLNIELWKFSVHHCFTGVFSLTRISVKHVMSASWFSTLGLRAGVCHVMAVPWAQWTVPSGCDLRPPKLSFLYRIDSCLKCNQWTHRRAWVPHTCPLPSNLLRVNWVRCAAVAESLWKLVNDARKWKESSLLSARGLRSVGPAYLRVCTGVHGQPVNVARRGLPVVPTTSGKLAAINGKTSLRFSLPHQQHFRRQWNPEPSTTTTRRKWFIQKV